MSACRRFSMVLAFVLLLAAVPGVAAAVGYPVSDAWTVQYTPPSPVHINRMTVVPEWVEPQQDVWAVGDGGLALKTADGSAWSTVAVPTAERLKDVVFESTSTGWICGDHGALLRTADGGASWESVSPTSADLRWLSRGPFNSKSTVWVFGRDHLYRSSDGGDHWQDLGVPKAAGSSRPLRFRTARFTAGESGIGITTGGHWAMSADGGSTWRVLAEFLPATFREVSVSHTRAFAVGDWGLLWDLQASRVDIGAQDPFPDLLDVSFQEDDHRGTVVGAGGWILRRPDIAGSIDMDRAHWLCQNCGTDATLTAVVTSRDDIWVADETGVIRHSGTGGSLTRYDFAEGEDRAQTAVRASGLAFPSPVPSGFVVLVDGHAWKDAVVAEALAGAYDCPILMTRAGTLPEETLNEMYRLRVRKVAIVGGTNRVPEQLAKSLRTRFGWRSVLRLSGPTGAETAAVVAAHVKALTVARGRPFEGKVFVAGGSGFPDAVAASPIMFRRAWPVLFATPTGLAPASHDAIRSLGVTQAVVLGGPHAVPPAVYEELDGMSVEATVLAGPNRYRTADRIATYATRHTGMSWQHVGVAAGEDFPDGVSGGFAAGRANGPLMLVGGRTADSQPTIEILSSERASIDTVQFFGGYPWLNQVTRNGISLNLR